MLEEIAPTFIEMFPTPIVGAVVLVTVLLLLGKKAVSFWTEISPLRRAFERERRRLEVLKLHHEIEALRRQHGGGDLADHLPPIMTDITSIMHTLKQEESKEERDDQAPETASLLVRVFSGAAGGLLMMLIPLVINVMLMGLGFFSSIGIVLPVWQDTTFLVC